MLLLRLLRPLMLLPLRLLRPLTLLPLRLLRQTLLLRLPLLRLLPSNPELLDEKADLRVGFFYDSSSTGEQVDHGQHSHSFL